MTHQRQLYYDEKGHKRMRRSPRLEPKPGEVEDLFVTPPDEARAELAKLKALIEDPSPKT